MTFIEIAGLSLTRLWHCFGTEAHRVDIDTICDLLDASATNVLPINTHRLGPERRREDLEYGFGGVGYHDLARRIDVGRYVKMLNINLRTTTDAAVEAAKLACDLTGERVLKLEVLTPDHRRSRDSEVVAAAKSLLRWDSNLIVLPLLSDDLRAARDALDAGCPLLRIMGSAIGSGAGIADRDTFERICSLPVPVVLDGGVGGVEHVRQAAESGAGGILVNSVLFAGDRDPVTVMREIRKTVDETFTGCVAAD